MDVAMQMVRPMLHAPSMVSDNAAAGSQAELMLHKHGPCNDTGHAGAGCLPQLHKSLLMLPAGKCGSWSASVVDCTLAAVHWRQNQHS